MKKGPSGLGCAFLIYFRHELAWVGGLPHQAWRWCCGGGEGDECSRGPKNSHGT